MSWKGWTGIFTLCALVFLFLYGVSVTYEPAELTAEDAVEAVTDQIEAFYDVHGMPQTEAYCKKLGIFQQGNYFFTCYPNQGSLHIGPTSFTEHHIRVLTFQDSVRSEDNRILASTHRIVLHVPYIPRDSEVWGYPEPTISNHY